MSPPNAINWPNINKNATKRYLNGVCSFETFETGNMSAHNQYSVLLARLRTLGKGDM